MGKEGHVKLDSKTALSLTKCKTKDRLNLLQQEKGEDDLRLDVLHYKYVDLVVYNGVRYS